MLIPHNADVVMDGRPWANWAIIAITTLASLVFWRDPAAISNVFVLQRGTDFSAIQLIGSQFGHPFLPSLNMCSL
jgi:hypothetical protein